MLRKIKLKKESLPILAGLLIVMCLAFFWCIRKSDLFIDEVYSYGLANCYYTPFLEDIPEDGQLVGNVLTRDDFYRYITVEDGKAFQFDSVYYNQTQDVHPPLFYFMLHTICSFFPGQFSKWFGLSINLVFYFLACLMLYRVACLILQSRKAAALAVLTYGISYGGLSTVVMIRMYTILTFFTVCLAYIVLQLYRGRTERKYYIAAGSVLFLGLFTQYFFVFFAFFFSAIYCLRELKHRRFGRVVKYAVAAFAGIGIFYLFYPSVITHLFAEKTVSGTTAIENMFDYRGMMLSIYSFVMQTAASYKAILWCMIPVLLAGCIRCRKVLTEYVREFDMADSTAVALAIALSLSMLTAAVAAPMTTLRYVGNILPLVAVMIIYIMKTIWRSYYRDNQKKYEIIKNPLLVLCAIVCIGRSVVVMPDYVESMPEENYRIISQYGDLPCIYVDDNYSGPLTQDLFELMSFEEVYVSDNFLDEGTMEYLQKHHTDDGIILYIDTDEQYNSGFDPEKVLSGIQKYTKFKNYELLFSWGFSATYRIF